MWAVLRIEVFSVRAASARRVVPYCSSNVTALQVLSHLLRRPSLELDGTIYDKLGEVRGAPGSPEVHLVDLDLIHPSACPK